MIPLRSWHAVVMATSLLVATFVLDSTARKTFRVNANYRFDYEIFNGTGNQSSLRLWITVNTTGWVGFGVGPNANMTNADLFIGGRNGTTNYGDDYFAAQNGPPVRDTVQNWFLESASETGNVTTVQVRRFLNTTDTQQDYLITNTTMNVLWSFGATDVIVYHAGSRGSVRLNLMA